MWESEVMEYGIKISVVVPIYNVEDYLKKCIESIVNQSYRNIEIILVDDGSTDKSPEICDYYAEVDNRIYVIHKKNGGRVNARKAGTTVATGDYILNIDGDDWIEKDRIEDLVIKGIMPVRADMIYMHGYVEEYENHSRSRFCNIVKEKTYYGEEIEKQIPPLLCGIDNMLFVMQIVCSDWMWAIKRELLQEKQHFIDDRIGMSEDIIFVWVCLLSAEHVTVIKQSGYHYVQRDSSITHLIKDHGNRYIKDLNVLYHQLKQYIEKNSTYPKETMKIFYCEMMNEVLLFHYELLLKKQTDYLYPFAKVKKGSRIVVYGAGKMGSGLMKYLVYSKDYEVVLWVDQNVHQPSLPEFEISPVKEIRSVNYDYIVIAVVSAETSREIKENLIKIGISEERIAQIDPDVITEDALPDEILNEKYIE